MNFIFVCPPTNFKVQHRLELVSEEETVYEAVACPACSRLHFINFKTGKLLGEGKK